MCQKYKLVYIIITTEKLTMTKTQPLSSNCVCCAANRVQIPVLVDWATPVVTVATAGAVLHSRD